MPFTGLDLLFLEINNLQESLTFYHDQLGFEIETNAPESDPAMATLRAGRLKVTLVQRPESMLRRGRGAHFFLGVGDVDAFHQQLKDRSLATAEPVDEGWGGRFITVEDPDKYRFYFVTWDGDRESA
jgi:uncharacterized glyoxalase superfamily protein PhnB